MADPIESTLDGVLKSFSIILTQSGPGGATLKLLSANPPRAIASIVETVATTVIQQVPIDLSWIQKDVRFTTPSSATDPFGGLPITSLAGVGIAAITNGGLTPPGISGLLNGLQGTIPIPVLTNVSVQLPGIFVGSFLIETFFSIPGLGREVLLAVNRSDYPVIQAVTVYLAVLTMVINLVADVLYRVVDPRVVLK